MSKLLELADRVESLAVPDREVFCAAFRAVFPEVSAGAWDAIDAWDAKYDHFCAMLDVGAWLDAAMTLVPEGASWSLYDIIGKRESVRMWGEGFDVLVSGFNAASALTASSLCARASQQALSA